MSTNSEQRTQNEMQYFFKTEKYERFGVRELTETCASRFHEKRERPDFRFTLLNVFCLV